MVYCTGEFVINQQKILLPPVCQSYTPFKNRKKTDGKISFTKT